MMRDMQDESSNTSHTSTARQPIEWTAPEYTHTEKSQDWYWILGLLAVAASVGAMLFNNVLFALLILIGSFVLALFAGRKPNMVHFTLMQRGIRIDETLYPFSNLESFSIAQLTPNHTPKLILEPRAKLAMHIYIPLIDVDVDHVHDFLLDFLPEENHEEPLIHHVMEWLGF
jgi:hypothetical protein